MTFAVKKKQGNINFSRRTSPILLNASLANPFKQSKSKIRIQTHFAASKEFQLRIPAICLLR